MADCAPRERREAPFPADGQLRGRSVDRRPRPPALLGRARHQRDAEVDPGGLRSRGRLPHRQPRPARRGLRGDRGEGAPARCRRVPHGRRPRALRRGVRGAGDQGQRRLRQRLPALHRARATADRPARGRVRPPQRLRHDRPRLYRQGQRPGPDRGDGRHPGAGAEDDRPGPLLGDGPRGGDRLRARARDSGQGRDRGRAVLDRRQPLGPLLGGSLDRGARPRARGRRLPVGDAAGGGAGRAGDGDRRL